MDFTDLYKQSFQSCVFSPNNIYLASIASARVAVRDADTLQIVHIFTAHDTINHIAWSPDSDYIMAASYTLGRVYVWSVVNDKWSAVIDEGAIGMVAARWSPTGRHILTFTDFQVSLFACTRFFSIS
jgi:WD40 repeat protein